MPRPFKALPRDRLLEGALDELLQRFVVAAIAAHGRAPKQETRTRECERSTANGSPHAQGFGEQRISSGTPSNALNESERAAAASAMRAGR